MGEARSIAGEVGETAGPRFSLVGAVASVGLGRTSGSQPISFATILRSIGERAERAGRSSAGRGRDEEGVRAYAS